MQFEVSTPIEVLRKRFGHVVQKGLYNANVPCPFHTDNDPSCSIHLSTGCFNCFSCQKTGSFKDLPNPPEATPIAAYEYRDRDDIIKYVKVRYFPKTFKLFTPCLGSWLPGLSSKTPLLYNLTELEKNKTDPVYIVEGEKDVETLKSKGYLATTAGGATSWKQEFTDYLLHRRLTIIPDNDEAGEKWLAKILATFAGKQVPRILSFPTKDYKDISEWVEKGFQVEDLQERVLDVVQLESVGNQVAIVQFNDVEEPEKRSYFIEGLIPEKFPTILYADGGQGKSLISMYISLCVVLGIPFLGRETKKGNVLYVDWELDVEEQIRRAYKICRGLGLERPPGGFYYYRPYKKLGDIKDVLRNEIKRLSIDLVIIDSFGFACGGNAEKPSEIEGLREAVDSFGTTTIIVDHQAKPQAEAKSANVDRKPYGTVYKYNYARSVIKSERISYDGPRVDLCLYHTKHNFGALAHPTRLRILFESNSITIEPIVLQV